MSAGRTPRAHRVFYAISACFLPVLALCDWQPMWRLVLLLTGCCLLYIGGRIECKIPGNDNKITMRNIFLICFILFVFLLARLTLVDSYFGRGGRMGSIFAPGAFEQYSLNSLNLTPFRTIRRYTVAMTSKAATFGAIFLNLAGNAAALAPFAFFLPLLFRAQKNFFVFLLTVAGAALAIELLQLTLMVGVCDIDDLLLNTLGAAVFFGLLHLPPARRAVSRFTLLPY